jgi:hypothetical protein
VAEDHLHDLDANTAEHSSEHAPCLRSCNRIGGKPQAAAWGITQGEQISPGDRRGRRTSAKVIASEPWPSGSPLGPVGSRWYGSQPRISIKETIGTLKSNKPLAYLCASSFFYLIGLFVVAGTTALHAQHVLGNIGLAGVITLVNTGIALLITSIIPKLIDLFGKKGSTAQSGGQDRLPVLYNLAVHAHLRRAGGAVCAGPTLS